MEYQLDSVFKEWFVNHALMCTLVVMDDIEVGMRVKKLNIPKSDEIFRVIMYKTDIKTSKHKQINSYNSFQTRKSKLSSTASYFQLQ